MVDLGGYIIILMNDNGKIKLYGTINIFLVIIQLNLNFSRFVEFQFNFFNLLESKSFFFQ